MPVSLRPPEGCSGASIGQLELFPDENGLVEIPDGVDYSELLNHGFTPCTEADLLPIRLKAAEAEAARIEAEVQKRLDAIMKGNAMFGKKDPAPAQAPAEAPAPAQAPAEDPAPAQAPAEDPAPVQAEKTDAPAKPAPKANAKGKDA